MSACPHINECYPPEWVRYGWIYGLLYDRLPEINDSFRACSLMSSYELDSVTTPFDSIFSSYADSLFLAANLLLDIGDGLSQQID